MFTCRAEHTRDFLWISKWAAFHIQCKREKNPPKTTVFFHIVSHPYLLVLKPSVTKTDNNLIIKINFQVSTGTTSSLYWTEQQQLTTLWLHVLKILQCKYWPSNRMCFQLLHQMLWSIMCDFACMLEVCQEGWKIPFTSSINECPIRIVNSLHLPQKDAK